MKGLGISAYYHDSAAVFIQDGEVITAVEEERFSRIKHDNQFPFEAIAFCLKDQGISIGDLDYIAYYEKPLRKFERILETFVATYPLAVVPFTRTLPEWLGEKLNVERVIRKKLGFGGKIYFVPHHVSHAAVSYLPSPFEEAAVFTVDGVGEYQTTGLWQAKGAGIELLKKIDFPHSLGLLYSTFAAFLGFRINEDEYKLMGLAAYGKPTYREQIYKLVDVKEDGSFHLDLSYFAFRETFRMWSRKFEKEFGAPRAHDAPATERDRDLAASIQAVTEEIYLKCLRHLQALTGSENLCIGGGVALNALANGKIYKETPFKHVYAFGAAGDSGAAVGAGLFAYHALRPEAGRQRITDLRLGSSWSGQDAEACAKEAGLPYLKFQDEAALIEEAAGMLADNKIVGWFSGKMEFGPRALGARSILANPNLRIMKDKVNEVKVRELFRPFAGSILQEHVGEYFDVPDTDASFPFMNFCFLVRAQMQDRLAAIVHEDASCRIQTVSESDGAYYRLIGAFHRKTGIPCVLNTSFNLKGEPIVESPQQAFEDFRKSSMDALVMEDIIVRKA